METWAALFERAEAFGVDEDEVAAALAARRNDDGDASSGDDGDRPAPDQPADDPLATRVVADADVLAADLLVGGDARAALDGLRGHSWTTLVASDALLDDAEAVIADLADDPLAVDWREKIAAWRERTVQPVGDHPALASAFRGGAMHVLSFDDRLTAPGAGAGLSDRFPVSVREPRAFAALFDAETLYPEVGDGEYPGPDRDPRA
jgi:hypothetical protein